MGKTLTEKVKISFGDEMGIDVVILVRCVSHSHRCHVQE